MPEDQRIQAEAVERVDTAGLRELLEKATPGPWAESRWLELTAGTDDDGDDIVLAAFGRSAPARGACSVVKGTHQRANAALIAAAVNALPALLANLDKLATENERLNAKIEINDHNHGVIRDIYDKDRANLAAERDALSVKLTALEGALRAVRGALLNEGVDNSLAVVDTVWVSGIETAVDCIDQALSDLPPSPGETPDTERHVLLCSDCPPVGYVTDKTRCGPCPRRPAADANREGVEP